MRVPLDRLNARRVAIVKPSALGDVIHASPVLSAVRTRFPEAHLTWVINAGFAPLLDGHPDLDRVIRFDRTSLKARRLDGMLRFASELRAARFDLVLDLQGLLRSGLMASLSGAPRRVGFADGREGSRFLYTDHVAVPARPLHAVDRCWLFAEALGVGGLPKRFHIPVQPAAKAWAEAKLRGLPRPWLAVAPGSRWATKRWPHFADLLNRARSRRPGGVVVLGAKDETDIAAALTARLTGPVIDLSGATDMAKLTAVLSLADVVLANDSGPLHLAAALGRPVVAPYTCTRVARHGPYGMESGAVETEVACKGSYLKTCSRMDCMKELTTDRLWPVLEGVLTRWQTHSRSA